jgi:hypothetical protein
MEWTGKLTAKIERSQIIIWQKETPMRPLDLKNLIFF